MPSLAPSSAEATGSGALPFREVQTHPRAWICTAVVALIFVAPSVWRIARAFPSGQSVLDVIQSIVMGGVFFFTLHWRLVTQVREEILLVQYSRLQKRRVPLSSIRSVDVVTYYPQVDRGWGVRRGKALRIWTSTSDFFLLGTRHPEELRRHLLRESSSSAV